MDIEKFKKPKKDYDELVVISARITKAQKEFIDSNNLNLSLIIRDTLNNFMKDSKDIQGSSEDRFEVDGYTFTKIKQNGKSIYKRNDEEISRHAYGRAKKKLNNP